MAGILIDSRIAFVLALLYGSSIITFTYLEIYGGFIPQNNWKEEKILLTDSEVRSEYIFFTSFFLKSPL